MKDPRTDPKLTHASDQLVAIYGTLGAAFAVFAREAEDHGCSREEAIRGAAAAVRSWLMRPIDGETPASEQP